MHVCTNIWRVEFLIILLTSEAARNFGGGFVTVQPVAIAADNACYLSRDSSVGRAVD